MRKPNWLLDGLLAGAMTVGIMVSTFLSVGIIGICIIAGVTLALGMADAPTFQKMAMMFLELTGTLAIRIGPIVILIFVIGAYAVHRKGANGNGVR